MKRYYHATSKENAYKILNEGFRAGQSGMFGGGIYFAEKPIDSTKKAHVHKCDSIIIAQLDVGRLMTEEIAHNNWNLSILKSKGYDSVQMRHCRTGPEICLYEPWRITIIAIVVWDDYNISFKSLNSSNNGINLNDFGQLIHGRRVIQEGISQMSLSTQRQDPEDDKETKLSQLSDLERSMYEQEKSYYSKRSNWHSNYEEKSRIDILHEYLMFQNELRQFYPDLKSKLDDRINSLLKLLRQENARINRENEFVNQLLRGIGSAQSLSSAPQMITIIQKYKNENNIN